MTISTSGSPSCQCPAAAAFRFVATAITFSGALWSHVNPPPAVEEVYATYPELTVMRVEFSSTLRETLATMLVGLIARPPC